MFAVSQITEPSRRHTRPHLLDSGITVTGRGRFTGNRDPVLGRRVLERNVAFGVLLEVGALL